MQDNQFKAVWIVAIVVPVVAVILLVVTVVACVMRKRNGKRRTRERTFTEDLSKKAFEGESTGNNSSESETENVRYLGGSMFNYQFLPVADYRRKLYEHRMNTVHEANDGVDENVNIASTDNKKQFNLENSLKSNRIREAEEEQQAEGRSRIKQCSEGDYRYSNRTIDKADLEVQREIKRQRGLDLERVLDEEIASRTSHGTRKSRVGSFMSNIFFGKSSIPDNIGQVDDEKETDESLAKNDTQLSTPNSKVIPNSTSTPITHNHHSNSDKISPAPQISFHINQNSSSLLPTDMLFDNASDNNSLYSFSHSVTSYKKLQRLSGSNQSASAASLHSTNASAISVGSVPSRMALKLSNDSNSNRPARLQSPLFRDDSVRPIRRRRSSLTHRSCNTPTSGRSINYTSPGSSVKQAAIVTANRLILDKPLPERPRDQTPPIPSGRTTKQRLSTPPEKAHHQLKAGKNTRSHHNSPHSATNGARSSPLKVTKKIRTSVSHTPSPASSTSIVTAKTSLSPESVVKENGKHNKKSRFEDQLPPPPPIGSCFSYEQQPPTEEEGVVAVVEQICRVTSSFKPKLDDELLLHRGDKVIVFKLFDDGWCTAQYLEDYVQGSKVHGVCPQGCLTPI